MNRDAIRGAQVAFFTERLVSERAAAEWREHLASAIDTLLGTRIDALVSAEALERAVESATSTEAYAKVIRPVSSELLSQARKELRKETETVGTFVPASAREKIDELIARPRKAQDKLLRRILEQEAMEETMRDVLFDALKEFNERVNPFVAEWGLPRILGKLGPFGLGPLGKSIDGVRAEFDRRLEPEMRKFLQTFSRKALDKTGDLLAKNSDSPKAIAMRRAIVAWVYEQELWELASNLDDEGADLAHAAALDVAQHVAQLEHARERRKDALARLLAAHGNKTVRELLASVGAEAVIDATAIAEATWPSVRAVLASEPVRAWCERVVGEFWATVPEA